MTRPGYLWLSLATSALAHGALGWQLQLAPAPASARRAHDPLQVRLLTLPPPPPPREPAPPPPEPPPFAPAKPKPTAPPPAPIKLADPALEAPEPMPPTAPPALLSDAPSGTGGAGVVQIPGAPIGSLATSSMLGPREPIAVNEPALTRAPPALAKLGDLSRKPRAPSLDASLRQHYPLELRRRAVEGQAEVRVVISPKGLVDQVSLLSESAPGFGQACKSTLLGTRWSEPLDRDGKPVGTRLTYRCRFQIERG